MRTILELIELEAQYGLDRSHVQIPRHGKCNAQRALEVIIVMAKQARGEAVAHPVNIGAILPSEGTGPTK